MAQALAAQAALQAAAEGQKQWGESTRRQELIIRGPPPKEAVSMVKYIVIAVVIIAVLLIYFGIGRKPQDAPKYQSVFDNFTPDRLGLPIPAPRHIIQPLESDATRVFGIIPRKPIRVGV